MKMFLRLAALASLLSIAVNSQPASVAEEKKKAPVTIVTPDEAEKLIKESPGLVVLDVRTPDEFAKGHIKGAKNIDFLESNFEALVAKLDPAKPLLLHCASGNRSSQALDLIGPSAKFPAIYHLKAGFSGWKSAGKPVEAGK